MEFGRCRKTVQIQLQNSTTFILRGQRCSYLNKFSALSCHAIYVSYLLLQKMKLIAPSLLQGDADGYDLVVVDAMHKANYASRICHSCRPNCEAK